MTSLATPPPQTLSLMSEIVSYPILLQHEESFTTKQNSNNNEAISLLYDVSSWMLYLSEIDSLLEQIHDAIQAISKSKRNKGSLSQSLSTTTIGGRTIKMNDLSESHHLLQKARNLISERALSILPGSYKLWKNYLHFRTNVYMHLEPSQQSILLLNNESNDAPNSSNTNENQESLASLMQSSPYMYPIASSQNSSKYKATISAFERSLVRMNKYPRIWLSYIHFVITHDTTCSVTNVRRLFNRALLALPATQHDLIWSEYLCYVLGKLPPKGFLMNRQNQKDLGPVVRDCKNGLLATERYPYSIPPETVLRVLRRYAHYYNPTSRELLANTAYDLGRYGEAAAIYCEILNDVDFLSIEGTSRHELWIKLADICTEHPEDISESGVDFEGIVRVVLKPTSSSSGNSVQGGGSSGFGWEIFDEEKNNADTNADNEEKEKHQKVKQQQEQLQASLGEMEGTLWTKLAQFHIRMGEFELARSIYEEAMENVTRVRDFSLIFDGYIKFEEGVIEAMMELMNEEDDISDDEEEKQDENEKKEKKSEEDEKDLDILLGDDGTKSKPSNSNDDDEDDEENMNADVELALARAENLMNRRPLLLNYVLLRQNPHNVSEWLKRTDLYLKLEQTEQAIASLEESFKKVDAKKSMNGSPAELYKTLANLYEEKLKDIESARSIYERVCCQIPQFQFRDPDDLAQCYAAWIEMELRHENWDEALSIARRSVAHVPPSNSTKVTKGLIRSMRLWNLLLDLEESLGAIQTCKDAYNRLLELKVATPVHVLNFASFLLDKKYFEESFTAYERGLDMFSFPHPGGKLLWKEYLNAFDKRYQGTKIHRSRELFDRCLESCPPEDASDFFILYGKFEEDYGLTKRALGVYERMCVVVPAEEKFDAYQLYIAKTKKYLGVTATRPIYESAISALEDTAAAKICCEYAKMEASLQEIDRSRTAFTYGAQLADPRRDPEYWGEWHAFEVSHGNEETFREMLRVKRGVQAAFSTVNYNAAEMGAGVPKQENLSNEEAMEMIAAREGVEAHAKERVSGFVQGKRTAEVKDLDEVERRAAKLRKVTSTYVAATKEKEAEYDDEEIDLDEDEEEVEQTDNVVGISDVTNKSVPSSVFGDLVSKATETTQ